MDSGKQGDVKPLSQPIKGEELNSWRRGFTPQAEIWNGRMAMFGLCVGVLILLIFAYIN